MTEIVWSKRPNKSPDRTPAPERGLGAHDLRAAAPAPHPAPLQRRVCACGGGCPSCRAADPIQARLNVGPAHDDLEKEADRVAAQVMRGAPPRDVRVTPLKGGASSATTGPREETEVQRRVEPSTEPARDDEEEEEKQKPRRVQAKRTTEPSAGDARDLESALSVSRSEGRPLPPATRAFMEQRFGYAFSGVRVHADGGAEHLARSLNAQAFTSGRDIYFNAGRYHPEHACGRELLAHELTHVVQQGTATGPAQSTAPRIQRRPEADVVAALNAAIAASDKPAYMNVLRTENGLHDASLTVWNTIRGHLSAGSLTVAEAWRAAGIQVLGDDTAVPSTWPIAVKNFVEGLESGTFTFPGMPPAILPPAMRDELVQTSIAQAHTQMVAVGGAGLGPFMDYQGEFNSLWDTAPFNTMSDEFDPTLSSKGPRTERSRHIFDFIYTNNATFRANYDGDVIGITGGTERMRSLADQYVGPESRNLIASPRLQRLRELFFARSLISSNNLMNASYVAFKNTIRPVAEQLDRADRDALRQSHQWRLIIDWTVSGENLRRDLARFLQEAANAAAAAAAAAAPPPAAAPVAAAPATAAALTADQQNFINHLAVTVVTSPVGGNSELEQEQLEFRGTSSRDPAGLPVESAVSVAPAAFAGTGQGTPAAWPAASAIGATHAITVDVNEGTAGYTDYTATLTLESSAGSLTYTPPTTTTRINDKRKDWFRTNAQHGLIFSDEHIEFIWSPGNRIEYFGGQQPLTVTPFLGTLAPLAPVPNRGVEAYAEASLRRNGAAYHSFARQEFGLHDERRNLGGKVVRPQHTATPDNMNLDVSFFPVASGGAAFHTVTQAFDIEQPAAAGTPMATQLANLLTRAQSDFDELNCVSPPAPPLGPPPPPPACANGTVPTILDDMQAAGGQQARIASAIIGGNVDLEPTLIRPDSASFIAAQHAAGNTTRTPDDAVAYFVGHTAVTAANTLIGNPGADAWQWGAFPNSVFVNLHPSSVNPATRRDNAGIIGTIVHEAVHAVDVGSGSSHIDQYKNEFRAYWMEGDPVRDALSSAFDPAMDNFGPKSERSRSIFRHLYGNPTYPFVRPDYDANTAAFRDRVNAYIVPDGINLIVSDALANFRTLIAGLPAGPYAAQQAAVLAAYTAMASGVPAPSPEHQEISGTRAWRELVESKYSGADLTTIKTDLHIPL